MRQDSGAMNVWLAPSSGGADGYSLPRPTVPWTIGGGRHCWHKVCWQQFLEISVNGGDGLNACSVSLCIQNLRFAVPWDSPSTGRVPLRGDGMLSDTGLELAVLRSVGSYLLA